MKRLNIDHHLDGYTAEINNCIDYNIAAAASYYSKEYLKIYCTHWAIIFNWNTHNSDFLQIRNKILNIMGLEMKCEIGVSEDNLISIVERIVNDGYPILMNVSTSSLFYALMYNVSYVNYINHSIIISGFDELRKLIFIQENSINREIISKFTNSLPFLSYQIKYDMLVDILSNNKRIIEDYCNECLYYIKETKKKGINEINRELYRLILHSLGNNKNDNLIIELEKIVSSNCYIEESRLEQFRRTYYHSLIAVFDFIEENIIINNYSSYDALKIEYLNSRNKIINIINKNSLSKNSVDINKINILIEEIIYYNKEIYNFLQDNTSNIIYTNSNENLIFRDSTKIWADSTKKIDNKESFPVTNLKRNVNYNLDDCVWVSSNDTKEHWVMIDLSINLSISEIIIEHSIYPLNAINSFIVFSSNDNKVWNEIKHIKDNFNSVTNIKISPSIICRYIKFEIINPNSAGTFTAIIRRLYIY